LRQSIAAYRDKSPHILEPDCLVLLDHQSVAVPICLGLRCPIPQRCVRRALFSIGDVGVSFASAVECKLNLKSRIRVLDFVALASRTVLPSRFALAEIDFPCPRQVGTGVYTQNRVNE
jgi:hypothetical protein